MVVEVALPWQSVLDKVTAERLANPALTDEGRDILERRLRAQRRHVDWFHKQDWPGIQEKLQKLYRITLSDDMEPHWGEPWKAYYWHPSTDLRGRTTWALTGPISADAASIAHYMAKGWRTRAPEEYRQAVRVDSGRPITPPEPEQEMYTCPVCEKSFTHRLALAGHKRSHAIKERARRNNR